MARNAAGLDVSGSNNPRWKGGLIAKSCEVCGSRFKVKYARQHARFCSMACVGISQKGRVLRASGKVAKPCIECGAPFLMYPAHVNRQECCSRQCSAARRSKLQSGAGNSNWSGGLSRKPYPWNFREISKAVISRDGGVCLGPECARADARLTAHHINYDKQDCRPSNLITLCSACNSRANFGRAAWQAIYQEIMAKRDGGGWAEEAF